MNIVMNGIMVLWLDPIDAGPEKPLYPCVGSEFMKLLLLHALSGGRRPLRWASDMELLFANAGPHVQVLAHHVDRDVPDGIKRYKFDGVLLTASCIANSIPERHNARMMERLGFLKDSTAVKIVFAQDDYFYADVRDEMYVNLGIHLIYSVCPEPYWQQLFPRFLASGGEARRGFTAYVTPGLRSAQKFDQDPSRRNFDISYRTFGQGIFPNTLGELKSELGSRFAAATSCSGLRLDISNRKKHMLRGDDWLRFLGNSRAVLGSPSGSSVIVRTHDMGRRARELRLKMAGASAEQLEYLLYEEGDRGLSVTGLSPRNLEAAATGTAQVLIEDEYDGFLTPWKNYIPLKMDFGNLDMVLDSIRDRSVLSEISNNARRDLLSRPELQAENHVAEVLNYIDERSPNAGGNNPQDIFIDLQRFSDRHSGSLSWRLPRLADIRDSLSDHLPDRILLMAAKLVRWSRS